jgi:class 3 adenylate cyclase
MHPERVTALVLHEPMIVADDDWGSFSGDLAQRSKANMSGEVDILADIAPSRVDDRTFREWYTRAGRVGASPTTAGRIWASVMGAHPRGSLYEQIEVPTLVLHRCDNRFVVENLLALAAERMPHATLVELEGRDHFPFVGDVDAFVSEIAAFVVGERRLPPPQRLLSGVLFTDLVGSTERAVSLGDADWKTLLDRHDAAVRAVVGRSGGSVVKTTGDGVLALLPSAAGCLRAAAAIHRELASEGLQVRIGAHIGDIDRRGDDVSGLAVNIAARVMAKAGTGEVVVTAMVVGAVAGQAVEFESLGAHALKGVPGEWELFRMVADA